MSKTLTIQFNGQPRTIETIEDTIPLGDVIVALDLKADRIAVELNGEIIRRTAWPETAVRANDRLEIVHFVGGGLA
jgi:sulfur carrier protein